MADYMIWRRKGDMLFDDDGNPLNGGKLTYFDAGTSNARTVYSETSGPTAWTQPITLDSNGRLTGTIYVPTGSFKEVVTDSADVQIFSEDNLLGAVDTSTFSATFAKLSSPLLTKATTYTLTTDDLGKLVAGNTSGGDFTLTLPSAATVTDGRGYIVQNTSSNTLTVATVSSQTITNPGGTSDTSIDLEGAAGWTAIVSDGSNWYAFGQNDVALMAIGALTPAADRLPYFTSATAASLATFTSFARTLLDDSDAATARTTLAAAGSSVTQTVNLLTYGMIARSTNGAASGSEEQPTNDVMISGMDFDASTAEAIQIAFPMPDSWDAGTVNFTFYWCDNGTGGSGDVVWGARARHVADDGAIDGSWGTAVTVTDTFTAANDLMKSSESSACTVGNSPAAGGMVWFEIYRDAADGADTYTQDARLVAVMLKYSTNTDTDA